MNMLITDTNIVVLSNISKKEIIIFIFQEYMFFSNTEIQSASYCMNAQMVLKT